MITPDQPGSDSLQRFEWTPGGKTPDTDVPAFRLCRARGLPVPVLVATPHAGRAYSARIVEQMRDPSGACLRLEDRLVDHLAQEIAQQTGACLLLADTPRAVIDLNRAPDDVDWDMISDRPAHKPTATSASKRSRSGLGLVPRRLSGMGEIWKARLPYRELEQRIETVHRPYHQALGLMLESLRDRWGAALLIDLHSMPPIKARFPDEPAPEFVIGDRFGASCQASLTSAASQFLAGNGRACALNRPYAGGYVLDRHAQPARGIHCLQLEVCRSTYLDVRLTEPSARLGSVARLLAGLVRELAAGVAALGGERGLPLAAE